MSEREFPDLHEFLNSPLTQDPLEVKFKAETHKHKSLKLAEITLLFKRHTENSSRWRTMSRKLDIEFASS